MLDHPVIDVALGLIFFYVVLSLVCSAVQEWVSSVFALRSKNLAQGIERLIGEAYAAKVYEHPIIRNLAKDNQKPSYIASETLSAVLLEIVAKEKEGKSYVACTADEVRSMIGKIDSINPVKEILDTFVNTSEDAANKLKAELAGWFDEGMVRVSGWYKRRVKFFIVVIAAVVTVAVNADSIQIAKELWVNDALRTSIAADAVVAAGKADVTELDATKSENLEKFPVGWKLKANGGVDWGAFMGGLWTSLLGWLITIAAVSLGAPFWFDLLGKVANLKGSGGKPSSRSSGEAAAQGQEG